MYIIGVDFGGTKTAYGLFDETGALLATSVSKTDRSASAPAVCDRAICEIQSLLEKENIPFSAVSSCFLPSAFSSASLSRAIH